MNILSLVMVLFRVFKWRWRWDYLSHCLLRRMVLSPEKHSSLKVTGCLRTLTLTSGPEDSGSNLAEASSVLWVFVQMQEGRHFNVPDAPVASRAARENIFKALEM